MPVNSPTEQGRPATNSGSVVSLWWHNYRTGVCGVGQHMPTETNIFSIVKKANGMQKYRLNIFCLFLIKFIWHNTTSMLSGIYNLFDKF
jgi:hypothetical protein